MYLQGVPVVTDLLRIPTRFVVDSNERGLATPDFVRSSKTVGWIRRDDPNLSCLISDAKFYADRWGPDGAPAITRAAKSLLKSLANQGIS